MQIVDSANGFFSGCGKERGTEEIVEMDYKRRRTKCFLSDDGPLGTLVERECKTAILSSIRLGG
jgi:hypothetical protein